MRASAGALILAVLTASTVAAVQLLNPSFEQPSASAGTAYPAEWFVFASTNQALVTVTIAQRKDGLQSIRFNAQKEFDAFQGVAQRFLCTPGKSYTFTAYVRGDANSPLAGNSYGQISLEWQDSNGVEITRVYGAAWGAELKTDQWTKFSVSAIAPEGAYYGVAVITYFSKNSAGSGGFYVDDCQLTEE